jgi:uncharacterized membrane protein
MENNKQKNIGMAILAYFLFFIPLLTESKKDAFVKYHVRQGLIIFICWVVLWVVGSILTWRFWEIVRILDACVLVLMVIGIINAAGGKEKPLPLIGKFGESIKI